MYEGQSYFWKWQKPICIALKMKMCTMRCYSKAISDLDLIQPTGNLQRSWKMRDRQKATEMQNKKKGEELEIIS